MKIIDIRSDTVTVPDEIMRQIIASAPVGDDVFGEDPAVNELEEYCAGLFGKEAALFVPSGTMGNQISIKINTEPGDEVICEADAHIYYYETAAPSVISNVQLRPLPSEKGEIPVNDIESAIRPDIYYFPKTKLIALETTHNRHGGSVLSLDYIRDVYDIVKDNNLRFHCDGARIWNACAATGIEPAEYAKYFDTLSVCLSKALGAPVGSVILADKDNIEIARKWRKILGGGMRQAGILAAAGKYAIEHNFGLLKNDHENAKAFGESLSKSEFVKINTKRIESNIVVFDIDPTIDTDEFVKKCKDNGVIIIPFGPHTIRAVFHFQVSKGEALDAAEIIKNVLNKIKNK